jgi:glycosyltransferase 2 family protein
MGIIMFGLFFVFLKLVPPAWLRTDEKRKTVRAIICGLLSQFQVWRLRQLIFVLGISGAAQFFDILAVHHLAKAIHVEQSLPFFLMVMPFVYVVTLLPISLGGLGGREGTLAFFLVRVGVATSDAVMLGFVIYVSRIAVSLLGSLWHYVSSHERRQDKFRQLGQE